MDCIDLFKRAAMAPVSSAELPSGIVILILACVLSISGIKINPFDIHRYMEPINIPSTASNTTALCFNAQ